MRGLVLTRASKRSEVNTKEVSEQSEAIVLAELLKRGFSVSLPFGDNQRYDLVLDTGNKLLRVQVKVGRTRDGFIEFDTCSSHDRKDYRGQVEMFAVYVFEPERVYLVPVRDVPITKARLRLQEPNNGQSKGLRWASDFDLDVILGSIAQQVRASS